MANGNRRHETSAPKKYTIYCQMKTLDGCSTIISSCGFIFVRFTFNFIGCKFGSSIPLVASMNFLRFQFIPIFYICSFDEMRAQYGNVFGFLCLFPLLLLHSTVHTAHCLTWRLYVDFWLYLTKHFHSCTHEHFPHRLRCT